MIDRISEITPTFVRKLSQVDAIAMANTRANITNEEYKVYRYGQSYFVRPSDAPVPQSWNMVFSTGK